MLDIPCRISAVWTERARAAYLLTFGAAFLAAGANLFLGLLLAWVLVRYRFPGKRLVDSLVDGLSRAGRLPVAGRVVIRNDDIAPGQGATNSAQRVAAVGRRLALDVPDVAGKRVLLVDDLVVTGWSLTLAAHWLREAGAEAVLPLALATEA